MATGFQDFVLGCRSAPLRGYETGCVSGGVFAIRLSVKRRIGAELDTAYGQWHTALKKSDGIPSGGWAGWNLDGVTGVRVCRQASSVSPRPTGAQFETACRKPSTQVQGADRPNHPARDTYRWGPRDEGGPLSRSTTVTPRTLSRTTNGVHCSVCTRTCQVLICTRGHFMGNSCGPRNLRTTDPYVILREP